MGSKGNDATTNSDVDAQAAETINPNSDYSAVFFVVFRLKKFFQKLLKPLYKAKK